MATPLYGPNSKGEENATISPATVTSQEVLTCPRGLQWWLANNGGMLALAPGLLLFIEFGGKMCECYQLVAKKRKGYMLHVVSGGTSVCNVLFSRMLHFLERLRISESLGDLVSAERRSVGRVNIPK